MADLKLADLKLADIKLENHQGRPVGEVLTGQEKVTDLMTLTVIVMMMALLTVTVMMMARRIVAMTTILMKIPKYISGFVRGSSRDGSNNGEERVFAGILVLVSGENLTNCPQASGQAS